jgi:hypothetical protein
MVVLIFSSVLLLLLAVDVAPSVPVALSTKLPGLQLGRARCNLVARYVLAGHMPAAAKLHGPALACMRARGCATALKALPGNITAARKWRSGLSKTLR